MPPTTTSPPSTKSPLSFSIIIETENLASADLPGLFRSLDALKSQTLSPLQAKEVLLVETGDVPPELLDQIRQHYAWITPRCIDPSLEYYQAKMRGVELTTGEVVVLFDSDCVYNPGWLAAMLTPFACEDVQMVAGETSMDITGPYEMAMAIAYIFPRYSPEPNKPAKASELKPTGGYFCNNVVFKRSLLTQLPIPGKLPAYRGNCVIHAHQLAANRHTIWQQPQARALHAPPNGLAHFTARFLMLGYDALCISRFAADPMAKIDPDRPGPFRPLRDLAVAGVIWMGQLRTYAQRLVLILREDMRYGLYLPLALPISAAALALYTVGLVVAYVNPAYWLNNKDSLEALLEHS